MLASAREDAGPLLGRDAETATLRSLLEGIDSGGGALVLRGEPGIGKSRLLAEAATLAGERNVAVLRATGVQCEASVRFSGLHQLLRPVRDHAARLLPAHRAVLDSALGLGDDIAPEHFRIAMAVLELLSEVAADAPLLVIAEDAHWLDRPSADVLAFVARRLGSDPILLLAAVRDGSWSSLVDSGLPEHRLSALDHGSAAILLDTSANQLTPSMRNWILREAAGNPLALVELPIAAARANQRASMPGLVPLTDQLEQAFAARVSDLPEETRLLLLIAALNDEERVSEVLAAGRIVGTTQMDVDLLDPAAEAAIVDLDERTVRFRTR